MITNLYFLIISELNFFKFLLNKKSPPNFGLKSEFSSYSKPVITVHEDPINYEEQSEPADDDSVLVDFSSTETASNSHNSSLSNSQNDYSYQLQLYIQQLLQEIDKLRAELDRIQIEVLILLFCFVIIN